MNRVCVLFYGLTQPADITLEFDYYKLKKSVIREI